MGAPKDRFSFIPIASERFRVISPNSLLPLLSIFLSLRKWRLDYQPCRRLDQIKDIPSLSDQGDTSFPPFSEQNQNEYWAYLQGGVRRGTRRHNLMINAISSFLATLKEVSNPYPIDLMLLTDPPLIIEGKTVKRSALHSVREAVGQLLEYKHFCLPDGEATLCILLDREPEHPSLIAYVEESLDMGLLWWDGVLPAGPKTLLRLAELGVAL